MKNNIPCEYKELYQYFEIRISFFLSLREPDFCFGCEGALDLFFAFGLFLFGCLLTSARHVPSSAAPQSQKNDPCFE